MDGAQIGILDGSDRRNLRVVYDDAWIASHRSTPLSVSMPLAARVHSGRVVSAYLWGLLPDNDRVLERWARTFHCSANDVFGLLVGVGADVAGAAQYVPPGVPGEEALEGRIEVLTEADVAALVRELGRDGTAWHARQPGRWSLAGAQAKVALAYDDATDTWGLPSGAQPTTHIIKPAIAGMDHHDLNEHLCLRAAAAFGLQVAQTQVRRFDAERALVVARYDRVRHGGRIVRVHQEDCCQALAVHPERKYEADGGPGVDDIARLLREVAVPSAQPDVEALLRGVAFNWLILGTDAHAKNYSLLLSGAQVRLAPLYDIASAAPYGEHPKKLRLAQKIGGEYRPAAIGGRHWDRLAIAAQVDPERLRGEIIDMAGRLPDALASAVGASDLDEADLTAARRIVDDIVDWLATCQAAMHH